MLSKTTATYLYQLLKFSCTNSEIACCFGWFIIRISIINHFYRVFNSGNITFCQSGLSFDSTSGYHKSEIVNITTQRKNRCYKVERFTTHLSNSFKSNFSYPMGCLKSCTSTRSIRSYSLCFQTDQLGIT
jgi:hypothetical protein